MTLAELVDYVRKQIIEPAEGFWTDAEIKGYIRECLKLISSSAQKKIVISYTVETGKQITLPDTVVKVHRVDFPTGMATARPLADKDKPSLSGVDYYCVFGKTVFTPTLNEGDTVTIFATVRPNEIASDTDTPEIPDAYHVMLGDYAVYKCKRKDDDEGSKSYYNDYLTARAQLMDELASQNKVADTFMVRDDWEV